MSGGMAKQTFFGEMADPVTKVCDWCGKTASKGYELKKPHKIVGTAQFIYACPRHIRVAKRTAEGFSGVKA